MSLKSSFAKSLCIVAMTVSMVAAGHNVQKYSHDWRSQ